MIVFEGSAFDLEDGTLGVAWKDEEGNVVGTGARYVLKGYEIGHHEFTGIAMDSDRNEVHASVSFEVLESPLPMVEVDRPFPGEVFVDQSTLSVPTCAPNSATFTAYIADPEVMPTSVTLLVSPSDEAPMLVLPMERDEIGLYLANLEVDENAIAGEWRYTVVALDAFGASYRSEPGTVPVNACGAGAPEPLISDQLLQLLPYLAIGIIAVAGLGLFVLGAVLLVARVRRK